MRNIAVVWDFDVTLTPIDSTTKIVEYFNGERSGSEFWGLIKALRGDNSSDDKGWEHVLASDAPIWMYSLSKIAYKKRVPLNYEFFREYIVPHIQLYENVVPFLQAIKAMETRVDFQAIDLKVHHFVVSAGLKELVEQFFPDELMTWVFGCQYKIVAEEGDEGQPESVPTFCMDETMKTRSLFEISKGSFSDKKASVNKRIESGKLWAPFENVIYVGDGPTDVPALSLVRDKGGMGVVVYNPEAEAQARSKRIKSLRLDKRADLIVPADYALGGTLFSFIENRCIQIKQRYEAELQD